MKLIVFAAFFFCMSQAFGQVLNREQFVKLTNDEKVEFLNQHAQEKPATSRQANGVLFKKLQTQSLRLADLWYDTILEGPYALTGDAALSESNVMIVNRQVYAYRFHVHAPAIFTEGEGCEMNEETEEWSEACFESAGTITESALFDYLGEALDDGSYAEFND